MRLPQPNPSCLKALPPSAVAAAYVASQKSGCSKADLAAALSHLFDARAALAEAIKARSIEERGDLLYAGTSALAHRGDWADARRDLAFQVLGIAPSASKKARALRDLVAAALRATFSLDNLPQAPSRAAVRCELLRRIVASFGEPFASSLPAPGKTYTFDAMSRRLYLAFAGVRASTLLDADAALLLSAFGGPAATLADLSETLLKAALKPKAAEAEKREEAFNLDGFAESVRKLARRLETKPYSGRVAIAQVYDAGLAAGLQLGTLDEFKLHLAEAAREGLLDLERYDITGPLDAGLKERSRLRLGRDERHFIVNQWI